MSVWGTADPFREPDWRWRRVQSLCERPLYPGRCSRRDDEFVRKCRAFMLRRAVVKDNQEAKDRLCEELPEIAFAIEIHERAGFDEAVSARQAHMQQHPGDDPPLRLSRDSSVEFLIQARVLAGQDLAEVAMLVGTTEQVLQWYTAMYFDVTESLHQRDWIQHRILTPAVLAQYGESAGDGRNYYLARPLYDATLKMFAYYGGPAAIDVLLSGFHHGNMPASPEDVPAWTDGVWKNMVRSRSARAMAMMALGAENVFGLFQLHAQLVALARDNKSDRSAREAAVLEAMDGIMRAVPYSSGATGAALAKRAGTDIFDVGGFEPRAAELIDPRKRPALPASPRSGPEKK